MSEVLRVHPSFFEGTDPAHKSPMQKLVDRLKQDDPSLSELQAMALIGEAHRENNWGSLYAL